MTVRILIASATDMKHHLPVADGVILIGGVLREAIALESKSLSFTIVSLVQIDVKNCRKQYIQLLGSLVGIFLNVGYLKPVYHAIGKKETGEEFIIVWCLVWCHVGKGTNFSPYFLYRVCTIFGLVRGIHPRKISLAPLWQIRNAIDGYIDKQRTNKETLLSFLCHYLSEEEVQFLVHSINKKISEQISSKLSDPIVGETVAKLTIDHISKNLKGDGARIILAGIGGIAKGVGGVAASLLGVDVVAKVWELLREPTERYLANNINKMLQEDSAQIAENMLGGEIYTFLEKRIDSLLEGHDQQLTQLSNAILSLYQIMIKKYLPQILKSIDVRRIVTERIQGMDMSEFEPVVLGVINNELRAVVWLGGALGVLIGCFNILI